MKGISFVALLQVAAITGCLSHSSAAPSPQRVVEHKFAAVNRHAIADIVALYSPTARLTASDFCAPRSGHEGVWRTYEFLFRTFPDIVADVHEYVTDGDRVVARLTVRGTAGGAQFAVSIANFFTVRDGVIVSDDGLFDNGGRPCRP